MSTPIDPAKTTADTTQPPLFGEASAAPQNDQAASADPPARNKGLSLKTLERRLFKFDMVLLVLVLVLAFFLGSFAAHNSDLFLHLGLENPFSAKTNSEGVGSEDSTHPTNLGKVSPFSAQAGESRWVHHAWLSSLILRMFYEPYSGQVDTAGGWGVVLKALVVVVLAGVLCLIRRREQSWLLPISCTALAVLVMSPRLMLQPVVVSLLFLGVTLLILTLPAPRAERAIWFLPVLFAIWVNMDQWFLLGPITLALWLVGLFMQQRLKIQVPAKAGAGHPPLKNLAIVLALGLAACLFNPWGYRAFTLPADLAQLGLVLLPRGMAASARAAAVILENDPQFLSQVSPFSSDYWSVLSYGKHTAGLAYFVLFFLGVGSFMLPAFLTRPEPAGSKSPESGLRCNLPMLAVFLFFAVLSAVNFRFIPFFAVAAGPITVLNLQDYGRRKKNSVDLVPMAEVNWALGRRMVALAVCLLLLVCAWAGWLHSFAEAWRGSHHAAWFVGEDPGVLAAANKVNEIHKQTGLCKLGFNYLLEGGNLFTWSSYRGEPGLRLMCDTRYAMSTDAAEAYGKIRKALRDESLIRLSQTSTARDQKEFFNRVGQLRKKYQDEMRRAGADYVILTGLHWDQQTQLLSKLMLVDTTQWVMLFNDGRTAVFGWVDPTKISAGEGYRKYRLNLDVIAAPSQMPPNVPQVALSASSRLAPAPTASGGDWHQFLYGPIQPALSWFESKQYVDLAMFLSSGDHLQEGSINLMFAGLGLAAAKRGWEDLKTGGPFMMQKDQQGKEFRVQLFRQIDLRPPGALLVAVRAGRNAVLEAPEDMKSYIGLGQAYQILQAQEDHWIRRTPYVMHYKPDLRHQFRLVAIINAFQDAAILQPDSWLIHDIMHGLYMGLGYFDLSLEQLVLARKSLDSYRPSDREDKEKSSQRKEEYDQRIKAFGEEVQRRQDAFKRSLTPRHNVVEQFQLALFNPDARDAKGREQVAPRGLIQQGLQILLQARIDVPRDDPQKAQRMLHEIASWQLYLLLTTGEAREANERLKDEKVRLMLPGGEYEQLRAMAAWALGDYAAADKFLEQAEQARALPPDEQILKKQKETTKTLTEHLASSVSLMPGPNGLVDPLSRLGVFQTRRHEILETLFDQAPERRDVAELRLLRGLLALEVGDAAAAAKHFHSCLSIQPTGMDLPDRPIAVRYLELLEGK